MSTPPITCSRCGRRDPNPGCYVCAEPIEDDDSYPNDDDVIEDKALERMLDRADCLRDKLRDDAMEDAMEARGEADEEERKLGHRDDEGRFGGCAHDDIGPDLDAFTKTTENP